MSTALERSLEVDSSVRAPASRRELASPASGNSAMLAPDGALEGWQRHLPAITWGFVALGVVLRLARYLLQYPLWGDEEMVAINFLDRGFADLARPLDYYQVCPLLFLWAELAVVKLWGFHELALRLTATMCSVASVLVFHNLAVRVLRGLPLALAMGMFAVSYYPIRHGAEVKPYAGDLFVTVLLLWMAVAWLQQPTRTAWLWGMAAVAPLCLGVSLTFAFVAGGVSAALLAPVWRRKDRAAWAAYLAFNASVAAAFIGLYLAYLRPLFLASGDRIGGACWADAFPPLDKPLSLLAWFVTTHTSHMLAYPVGSANGGSTLTALLCVVALAALCRRRLADVLLLPRGELVAICLAPLGLGLIAAALHQYPYGGSARTMQYAAPAICLLSGLGMAAAIGWARRPAVARRWSAAALLGLSAVGAAVLSDSLLRPYKTTYERTYREFARWFWSSQPAEMDVVCAIADLRVDLRANPGASSEPDYLCQQRIFRRPAPWPLPPEGSHAERPVRVVVHREEGVALDPVAVERWSEAFAARYGLRRGPTHEMIINPGRRGYGQVYGLYDFLPRSSQP